MDSPSPGGTVRAVNVMSPRGALPSPGRVPTVFARARGCGRAPWAALGLQAFFLELVLAATGGLIYFLVRGSVVDRVSEATARAESLMDLERTLGLFWEPAMQRWILSSDALIDLLNAVYFWGHMPVILAAAVLLYWRRRSVYAFTRNAFLASAVIALAMYYALPVAPPRFFPDLGFVDTMALYSKANYQAQEVGLFVNPYAALPSLHFGWALLIAVAVWSARPQKRAGALLAGGFAVLLPVTQFFGVLLTGNHFILDLVAGAIAAAFGWAAAWWWQRRAALASDRSDAVEPEETRSSL
ncbi:MAG: phosphatase PAP2 family protein [Dehalococcoidia bacterium]